MKLPFLSNQTDHHNPMSSGATTTTWPWPSCAQTRTLSFRATNDIFKTMNTTFQDAATSMAIESEAQSASSPSPKMADEVDPVEAVIQGLRSERLFCVEPGETSSILEEANKPTTTRLGEPYGVAEEVVVPFKESVALSLESRNPYLDFKVSMEEMVEAQGIKEWEGLEELLCWYLKVNGKDNHGYIVGAFVDLLVGLAFDIKTSPNNNTKPNANFDSPYSPLSLCNTCSSSSACSSISSSSSSTPNCGSSLIGVTSDQEIETPCLSSLLESTEEENDDDDVSS